MAKNTKGFTLVELLVAMTIVMVLTVVGIVNYSSAQKSARDAKRKSDLEKVRIALEMAKQDHNGCYPPNSNSLTTDGYLDKLPGDTKEGWVYCFAFSGASCDYKVGVPGEVNYTLYARMEAEKNWNMVVGGVGSTTSCVSEGGVTMQGINYKVINP